MTSADWLIAGAIAETLRRSWAPRPPAVEFPAGLPLAVWSERLVAGGAGGLGWLRIRDTELASRPEVELLRTAFRHHALTAARQERDLVHLLRHFNEAGLEPILFKGWSLARLYPHRALRPFGDFDLLVREEEAGRAREVLRRISPDLQARADVDTARTLARYLPDRTEGELFGRSRPEALAVVRFRTLAPEDHLRLVVLHQLHHGGWRPLWLCDVAVLLESLPADFDWEGCLAGDHHLSEGVLAALALAEELLGARLPPAVPRAEVPEWLRAAVFRGWVHGYESMPPSLYDLRKLGVAGTLRALRVRWPDPVSATVHLRAPFGNFPRLPVQTAECLRRGFDFIRRDIRWRTGLDAQVATVGKGVVP
ncbi:MAG TPA: nucleotidyltransferase family protein [Myxococcaceae bacterium]|nr:nucleotidyltransferase family protein [Myxococcaceae bacterium]